MYSNLEPHALQPVNATLLRALDIVVSAMGLLVFSPVIVIAMVAVWWQDGFSPFYVAKRVACNEQAFAMVKLRSMVKNADKTGVASTSANDNRITAVGHFIRRYKLDEITQLWNVLIGQMSLVGPRPNVSQAVATYTAQEKQLLSVRPGITDLASIVFSDEGDILKGSTNPDLLYEQIIRPWKSRLGLFYVEKRSLRMNIELIALTVLAIINKPSALRGVERILVAGGADDELIRVARRNSELYPFPPPGASQIVQYV
jgi:lipopolysaccharide/colanic/teichoic acid biosynthesis glycosyltransferase